MAKDADPYEIHPSGEDPEHSGPSEPADPPAPETADGDEAAPIELDPEEIARLEKAEADLDLEAVEPDDPRLIDRKCPNCGAVMPDRKSLVCLKCGYDQVSLAIIRTATGTTTVKEDEAEKAEEAKPVSRPGRGDLWLPATVAGVAAFLLVIGYFAVAPGLFKDSIVSALAEGESIGFRDRMSELGRFLALSVILVSCGMGAVVMLGFVTGGKIGDARLAAVRVAAIVMGMRVVTFLSLTSNTMEWLIESVLQAGILLALTAYFFSLKPRDAVMYGVLLVINFVLLWSLSEMVSWVA